MVFGVGQILVLPEFVVMVSMVREDGEFGGVSLWTI